MRTTFRDAFIPSWPRTKWAWLGATLLLVPVHAGAQTKDPPARANRPNALVADLGLHVVNLGYQRTLGSTLSLQLSAGLYGPWTVNNNVLGLAGEDHDPPGDVLGFVIPRAALRVSLGSAPTGFWLSPFAQAGPVRATRGGETLSGAAYAGGLSAGYAFSLGERFLLALGAGAQYHVARFHGDTAFPGFARGSPTLDLNVDYTF